jgi:ubiquinone/menaquinone biosynthesis C-methylase UbiE
MPLNAQARHYDEIIDDYDRHYYDRYSLQYRERFILRPLFKDVDLRGKRVADLASGSGETSLFLAQSFPGVELTGFDISPDACRRYQEKVGRPAHEIDLTAERYDGPRFDAAVIMGGLHHCVANLPHTLHTISTMLEPGGTLLLFEPNREYVLEPIRQLWYRRDRYFDAANEAALAHDALLSAGDRAFVCDRLTYFGGPAFFLVYNSLIFRLKPSLKARVSPLLLSAEAAYNHLPGRWMFASFLAKWTRV